MDQRVSGGCVGGFELHGQRPQAALRGAFKSFTVLQQSPVQMQADVCLETLREAFEHLDGRRKRNKEGKGRKENKTKV